MTVNNDFTILINKTSTYYVGEKVFKKQMKEFAVEMMQEYALSTDNDIDDELVARIKKAMRLGAV